MEIGETLLSYTSKGQKSIRYLYITYWKNYNYILLGKYFSFSGNFTHRIYRDCPVIPPTKSKIVTIPNK